MSSYLLRRAPAAARAFSTSSPRTLARISIIGNLGEAPELQTTSNGQEIVKYVVASNSGPASNRHTSWFHVTKFLDAERKGKDFFLGLQKGTLIHCEGDCTWTRFNDSEGNPRNGLNIIQRSMDVLRRPQPRAEDGIAEEGGMA